MTVYLVGAGPGDPGLLTVRGAEVLGRAEVVVYDRLSVASLLERAPTRAKRICVGKAPGRSDISQDEINSLLIEHGRAGQEVVRLKGGDPFVFARGGEEARALQGAGVQYEVVPGVTSAVAVPAYAGIPVTLRHSSTSFTVVTGHEDPDKDHFVDWDAIAKVGGTIVILMGVRRWPSIATALIRGGRAPDTPAAAVRWGTRPEQTTIRATLDTLAQHELRAPATIVVGEVATERLRWFESRPLLGRRIVVTRARAQAPDLSRLLTAEGAVVIEVPVIEIVDPPDGGAALRRAVSDLWVYDWVVLTSVNGASRLFGTMRDSRDLGGVSVAVIGPGTAAEVSRYNVVPDLVPDRFVAESLVDAFPAPASGDGRVLVARAAEARDVLPEGLVAKGWSVDVVEAYSTKACEMDAVQLRAATEAEIVTFASSSTVRNFVAAVGRDNVPGVVACIGPVTAETARLEGLDVAIEAEVHTVPGLVESIVHWASS
ncbi:MAG: Siroheme synthase [Acidimicrobiales bacterium]|nr:MAG: uroporphyrinogen-III C-methyltransferase [Actinomycetota bacterium]MBV6507523.1 Siroheme synthase [Acidimicrobiales bacterium]RIK07896.1 MAG: uroporphyrinogen-III C-methyltransferase [Acidobacteriota bacterium]